MRIAILIFASALSLMAQRVVAPGQINKVSGDGNVVVTTKGTQTPGDVVVIDANGNHVPLGSGNLAMVVTLPDTGVVDVSGTTLTLTAAHNGHILNFTSATDVTVTVPSGLGRGYGVLLHQTGAGNVIVQAGAGVTMRQRQSFTKTAGQYAVISLNAVIAADTITFSGDGQ